MWRQFQVAHNRALFFIKQISDHLLVIHLRKSFPPQLDRKGVTILLIKLSEDLLLGVVATEPLQVGALLELLSDRVVDLLLRGVLKHLFVQVRPEERGERSLHIVVQQVVPELMSDQERKMLFRSGELQRVNRDEESLVWGHKHRHCVCVVNHNDFEIRYEFIEVVRFAKFGEAVLNLLHLRSALLVN